MRPDGFSSPTPLLRYGFGDQKPPPPSFLSAPNRGPEAMEARPCLLFFILKKTGG